MTLDDYWADMVHRGRETIGTTCPDWNPCKACGTSLAHFTIVDEVPQGKTTTSRAAFESIRGEQRRGDLERIVRFLEDRGDAGSTCEEAEIVLKLKHQTCSARFNDLKRLALVSWSEKNKRRTTSNRQAHVYVLR